MMKQTRIVISFAPLSIHTTHTHRQLTAIHFNQAKKINILYTGIMTIILKQILKKEA